MNMEKLSGSNIRHVSSREITCQSSKLPENDQTFQRNVQNIPQFSKRKPKDVNMQPVGVGNT